MIASTHNSALAFDLVRKTLNVQIVFIVYVT